MDISVIGDGKLKFDTDILLLVFNMKKLKFKNIEFLLNIISVRSSSYEEHTVSNHYHFF